MRRPRGTKSIYIATAGVPTRLSHTVSRSSAEIENLNSTQPPTAIATATTINTQTLEIELDLKCRDSRA